MTPTNPTVSQVAAASCLRRHVIVDEIGRLGIQLVEGRIPAASLGALAVALYHRREAAHNFTLPDDEDPA